jgi:serine phosphatase RsbU (regulator of sigma subunit)
MARPGSVKPREQEHPPLDDRLAQACAEVALAIQEDLRIVPTDPDSSTASVSVAPGWALVGDADERRLRGAAELIGRLSRSDDEIRGLCAEVVERYEEVTLVYRLCERLGGVDGEATMARGLWLREGDGLNAVASFPPTPVRWNLTYSEALSVMHDGKPWVQESGPDGEAAVAVPLPSPGGPIGLMALWGRSSGREYRSGDVKLLTAIATLTAAFIRNERLAAEARRAEARARDDEIARQVHRGLLPHGEPTMPGLEISGCCRAAENVGGDYYGYISMPDGSLGLVMADVSGHGVAAALYMAAAKGALRAEARRILSPAELLRRANGALVGDFSASDVFATVFVGRFGPGGRGLEYANGGHNPPLLVRGDGSVEALGPTGPALGFIPGLDYREESRRLESGDVLVVYTDGLVESRDSKNRLYGMDRLREAAIGCRELSAAGIRDRLLEGLESHCDGKTAHDDVTLVVIRTVEGEA